MLLNTHDLVNSWSGIVGSTTLDMTAGSVTLTGGTISFSAPTLSEPQSTWYNQQWWKAPTYNITPAGTDVPWFELQAENIELGLTAGSIVVTGGTITFSADTNTPSLDMTAGSVTITGGTMTSSVPLVMTHGHVSAGGGSMTLQIEYTSEEFLISNSSTFDDLGIVIGRDIALNISTGDGFLILARVDVDTLFLNGIFGTPPQPYKIQSYLESTDIPAMITVEYNGSEWVVVDKTTIGI